MDIREFSDLYNDFLFLGPLAGINLTAISGKDDFFSRQIIDSVLPFEKSNIITTLLLSGEYAVVDIGFGGGFPIIPLAFSFPAISFFGIEAKQKKVLAVEKIISHFNLRNVRLFADRLENIFFDQKLIILSKGVSTIEKMLKGTFAASNVYVYFYKGPNLDSLEKFDSILGQWEIVEDLFLDIPGTNGRRFVGFKKRDVPRGTKAKKNLVKFSELI
ncbi:MAG: hypothetical protein A2504_06500 [Bdellovibrionales bacterium RIFOXYD12_FULL_39_22]|nr:MAG: hypothetical protein A2385_08820 [Bdellovibrionales bacterium RIFOXYB1_FULL_39_21]OFZ45197.1 MAG: hypothetical protein A2485_05715 [Bdellovibrionales bacterium RIFOXYC12_FULL_39_17]OFZ45611.1 MAG: hypothetical protein A2404_03400 [Bdellovibrionales bacterium RIFOXYC1_FULL_39_130]OFZ70762.1 MAG: hypothetical protein A2451_05050 [Bdellovibrionales bacterium RIFOXYC2_FULL_39_8]OFZ77473.1 MAG: hypothetical protein A2560_08990 [Bdellovibrionales bacterium RIFOXYD1_FULL_39_84]OFZ91602.1 MAG: